MDKTIDINIKEINFIIGWELDTESQICGICEGNLIAPPKTNEIKNNVVIKNDKVIVGTCEHAYHETCLEDFKDLCYEDSLIFKVDKVIETDMSTFMNN
jgi:hypothetical protein